MSSKVEKCQDMLSNVEKSCPKFGKVEICCQKLRNVEKSCPKYGKDERS